MTPFAIAGLQLELAPTGNLDLVLAKIRTTKLRYPWVQMIVLSELAVCGAGISTAEALPSACESKLAALANTLNIWLVTGSLYEKVNNKVYNTASVINPTGEIVARYRKMYPFLPYEKGVTPGQDLCLFDVPQVGRFGLSICYDIWFPETSRALVSEGAEVLIHPTLTNSIDRDVECAIVRATAAQQQCYVVDINGAGEQANGRSVIAGPDGEILHQAGECESLIALELDIERVRRSRERGLLGLGQPLKSFRDAAHSFPQEQMKNKQLYLDTLGPLVMPK